MEFTPTTLSKRRIKNYIVHQFTITSQLALEDKINFTANIINNIHTISYLEEFYKEDCHIILLEWIWSNKSLLIEDNLNSQSLRDLLFNIIIILESFPFNFRDIIDNCFISKLRIMRRLINSISISLSCRMKNLANYWSKMALSVKKSAMLQKKRNRNYKQINENESKISSEDTDLSRHISFDITNNQNKKLVTWKSDLVDIVEFCSDKSIIYSERNC